MDSFHLVCVILLITAVFIFGMLLIINGIIYFVSEWRDVVDKQNFGESYRDAKCRISTTELDRLRKEIIKVDFCHYYIVKLMNSVLVINSSKTDMHVELRLVSDTIYIDFYGKTVLVTEYRLLQMIQNNTPSNLRMELESMVPSAVIGRKKVWQEY